MRAMTETVIVGLLSGDLMFESQLQTCLQEVGAAVANTGDPAMLPECQLVFVDLNRDTESRLEAIGRIRDADPQRTIVGFCHHGEKDLRRRGMEAGASHVIANRFLRDAAIRLVTTADLGEPPPGDD